MINISALTYLHNKSPRNLVAFNHTLIASSSSEVDWAQLGGFCRSCSQLLPGPDVHIDSLTYVAEGASCGLGAMLSLSNGAFL